ncbi:MAG: CoA ligase, partial [Caldimonas sp.]
GKRSSIGHLNFHLNAIDGVIDGTFWMPRDDDTETPSVARLVAFVVAPGVAPDRIRAALRARIDAAFLPRRIIAVDSLPREATGKLTSARLAALAAAQPKGDA